MRINDIQYDKLKFIGRGFYAMTFGYKSYAIKFGTMCKVATYQRASDLKLSPKLYDYEQHVLIPSDFITACLSHVKWADELDQYFKANGGEYYADIMIVRRAKPIVLRKKNTSEADYWKMCQDALKYIQEMYEKLHALQIEWDDNHEGNIGLLRNKPVILDW